MIVGAEVQQKDEPSCIGDAKIEGQNTEIKTIRRRGSKRLKMGVYRKGEILG